MRRMPGTACGVQEGWAWGLSSRVGLSGRPRSRRPGASTSWHFPAGWARAAYLISRSVSDSSAAKHVLLVSTSPDFDKDQRK